MKINVIFLTISLINSPLPSLGFTSLSSSSYSSHSISSRVGYYRNIPHHNQQQHVKNKNNQIIQVLLQLSNNSNSEDTINNNNNNDDVATIKDQTKEINKLLQDKEQKTTAINRLKFQLNDLRSAAEESESKLVDAEKKVEELTKESEVLKKENDEKYESLKATFGEERELLQKEIAANDAKMIQMKEESEKEYKALLALAEEEKVQFVKEIHNLQTALDETDKSILKAKEEMDIMSKQSATELKGKLNELGKKDEEIQRLTLLKQKYEEEIRTLEENYAEQSQALEESQKQSLELQVKLAQALEDSEKERLANIESIAAIKEEMNEEKESFSSKLRGMMEQMNILKLDNEKEIKSIQEERSEEKNDLENEIYQLQKELGVANEKLDRARKSVNEVRKAADAKVAKMQKSSDAYKTKIRQIAMFDSQEMKRKVWNLETKLDQAKYNLITKEKESKALKEAVSSFEQQIIDLEEKHKEEMSKLEEKMATEEMFYAKSKVSNRQRILRIVDKFQRRLVQQEVKAVDRLEIAEQQLQKLLGITMSIKRDDNQSIDDKSVEVYNLISKVAAQMEANQKEFDAKVKELEETLADANKKAQKDMKRLQKDHESELRSEQKAAEKARKELIKEKDIEISKIEQESRRTTDFLRIDLTKKLNISENEVRVLKATLKEKEMLLSAYESERRSYRKLAKLALKATREKFSNVVRRRKKP